MARGVEIASPLRHVEQWLGSHRPAVLVAIVTVSILLRLIYWLQLSQGPCLWQHRWDQSDMNFFHTWATEIAAGDWLTDRPQHPLHEWHKELATRYFDAYPAEAQRITLEAQP